MVYLPCSGEKRFPLKVSVGIHNVHSTGSSAHVAHALYHRDYAKGSAYNNDIAVLVLTEAVGPATGVVPACLPSPGGSCDKTIRGFRGVEKYAMSIFCHEVAIHPDGNISTRFE